MHNTEHKPAQEAPESTLNQKDTMKTERHKLPRSWRYTIIGGSVLLVFAVIITGLLAFALRLSNGAMLWRHTIDGSVDQPQL